MLNLAEIQSSVLFYLSEFGKLSNAQPVPNPRKPSWMPPSEDTYKINIDGSFFQVQEQEDGGLSYRTIMVKC